MKKLLVDLSALQNFKTGLGQVAFGYGNYFKENYSKAEQGYELHLLLPEEYFGAFGNEVKYISSDSWLRKHSKYCLPRFDVWHSIHQLSRFKPRSSKTKYILTIHDLNYLYEFPSVKYKKKQNRRINRKIRRADEIVCISNFTKEEILRNLEIFDKDIKVIYNQVKLIDPSNAKEPTVSLQKPFFFAIGVLLRKKNFHVLLDLMKLMPEKHLYIAGNTQKTSLDSDYYSIMKQKIESEGIQNVTFMGGISNEEKVFMYQNCEAFLIPSLLEGFGLPVIEAMQFGKPVFSSPATSLREIGDRYAYFWDSFEPEEMKRAIDENLDTFYQDPALAEAEKQYAKSFASDRHFEEYQKIYNSLLNK